MKQHGVVLWFTGLSAAGKSTLAIELEKKLHKEGKKVCQLDADRIRCGLNADLGFSEADRKENIRRIAEVAAIVKDTGMIVLVTAITPLSDMRQLAREIIGEEDYWEIYVKADLQTCIQRDPKGLYEKAVAGEIRDFTGISASYEEPQQPDLQIDTMCHSLEQCVQILLAWLKKDPRIFSSWGKG